MDDRVLWISLILAGPAVGLAIWVWRRRREWRQEVAVSRARREFMLRREWLEAKFVEVASNQGRPRGLMWADCEFGSDVSFAKERKNGKLTALVAVAIQFEPVIGGGMEDVEAVAYRKAATAVFQHERGGWVTQGRAIFNLNPDEAIEFYHSELETVE
jgi:hypothetical protein